MGKICPMQMPPLTLACFTLLLVCPLATSTLTTRTTSKDEIKCDTCTPVVLPSPPPPPKVIPCPPPPVPPSFPPPQPLTPPACPACQIPSCNACPPQCPGCPPPPCNVCQMPSGGAVYSPPDQVYPYLTPPSDHSAATPKHLKLNELFVSSIIGLLLSATFSFFWLEGNINTWFF